MSEDHLGGRLRRAIDFLGSGRLAVILLLCISFVLYLYLVIPQTGEEGERVLVAWVAAQGAAGRTLHALGFTDVLRSWLFWCIYALLLVNLSVCMTRRLSYVLGLSRFPEHPPAPGPGWAGREVEVSGLTADQVAESLRRRGYRTSISEELVYGLRGRFASIGHWVFHAGMLAILIVGGLLATARSPFGGSVGVGEGEPFDLHTARFVSARQDVDPEQPPLRFRVDRVAVDLQPEGVKQFEVTLTTPEDIQKTIWINRPHRSGSYQVLVHGFGFMPGWVIVNSRGRAMGGAWLKLLPYPLQEEDSFSLGPEDSTAYVRFYPDHQLEGDQDQTLSQELRNPRFRTSVIWRGVEVYKGLLAPGERVHLEEGVELFFLPEIRKYALLDILEERGQTLVLSCLVIMILGLLVRYGRIRKEIVVRVGDESLQLHGHGEIFEHLFAEELDQLAGELREASPSTGQGGGGA